MPEHIKSQTTIASISDRRCVLADMARQSLGADRCPTATSMNKAVCTTHCGIGIVSDPIRWRVECGGGAPYMLSPDALTALCPAKN